jgi:hypothetical protein
MSNIGSIFIRLKIGGSMHPFGKEDKMIRENKIKEFVKKRSNFILKEANRKDVRLRCKGETPVTYSNT